MSFIVPPESIRPDPACAHRQGSKAAAALPWSDFYHHPALSLREDLLRPEGRLGLQRGAPADPQSLLLSGPVDTGMALLNAARALRTEGVMEASWVPEVALAAEIGRRAPTAWVRLNPENAGPGRHALYRFVHRGAEAGAGVPCWRPRNTSSPPRRRWCRR